MFNYRKPKVFFIPNIFWENRVIKKVCEGKREIERRNKGYTGENKNKRRKESRQQSTR